jgi:hypothetical protein
MKLLERGIVDRSCPNCGQQAIGYKHRRNEDQLGM